jgi:hypothetical protein
MNSSGGGFLTRGPRPRDITSPTENRRCITAALLQARVVLHHGDAAGAFTRLAARAGAPRA